MSSELPLIRSKTMERPDLPLMMRLAQQMPEASPAYASNNSNEQTSAQYGTHVQTTATQMDINVDWTFD
jgi:hypothetical protein